MRHLNSKIALVLFLVFVTGQIHATVIYDEEIDGHLPNSISSPTLTLEDIQRFTVDVSTGVNKIIGKSETAESILLRIPPELCIAGIRVKYNNDIDTNDHILSLSSIEALRESPPFILIKRQLFFEVTPMPEVQEYFFRVPTDCATISNGVYNLFSGTSTTAPPSGNNFELTLEIKGMNDDEFDILDFLPAIIQSSINRNKN